MKGKTLVLGHTLISEGQALRSAQADLPDACGEDGSCDHSDDVRRITVEEIDELCESINFDGIALLE